MMKIIFTLLLSIFMTMFCHAEEFPDSGSYKTPEQSNSIPDLGGNTEQTPQKSQSLNGVIDFGLGFGFADVPEDLAIGWDLLFGYEFKKTENWNIGAQLHYVKSLPNPDYRSIGLNVTVRPENRWLSWLQLRTGIVSADYSNNTWINSSTGTTNHYQLINWGGTGEIIGAGVVIGQDKFKFHLLDVERVFVAGHSFDVYTISIAILLY